MAAALTACAGGDSSESGAGGKNPGSPAISFSSGSGATLVWDVPGDPTITGYTVYWGTESRFGNPAFTTYQRSGDVDPRISCANVDCTFTVSDLQSGQTYYFALTARNSAGSSDFSQEVARMMP